MKTVKLSEEKNDGEGQDTLEPGWSGRSCLIGKGPGHHEGSCRSQLKTMSADLSVIKNR